MTMSAEDDGPPRYARRATLGEGGMGIVRAALDRDIGREIAIKSLRPGLDACRAFELRFLREAYVQARLEHPGIVPVYDLGRDTDGALYFSMKRIRGATLEAVLERLRGGDAAETAKRYTTRKLLTAFVSVCQTVHYAHTHSVVHRDLKPSNVMLGDYGEVYVLDWGVAALLDASEPTDFEAFPLLPDRAALRDRTTVGETVGTPGYLSPEQARGESIDVRADVYALGAILFEILALEPLHASPSVAGVLVSTVRGVDARVSVRAPHRRIAPELDAICLRATALECADRFQSVAELLGEIERFLDGHRDRERRAQLASEHALAASMAAEDALGSSAGAMPARRRALRDLGRALALDPSNAAAMRTFVSLLTSPPRELPAEAEAELNATTRGLLRRTARDALAGYLGSVVFVPFALWMGVRDPVASVVVVLLWAAAATTAYVSLQRADESGRPRHAGLLATTLAATATCSVCGPYVLVPTLAVINVILWLLVSSPSRRIAIVAFGWATILLPAALDWAGIVHFYRFREGRVTILQGALDFPPLATHVFLLGASLTLVAVAAVLVARFRDNVADAERRLQLHAWQLAQIVSPAASERIE